MDGMTRSMAYSVVLLAVLVGCGDDGGDGSTSFGPASDGTTDGLGSGGATETGANGADTGPDTGADTGPDTGADTGATEGETGQALGCADFEDEGSCTADGNCQALFGRPAKQNGPDAPCLEPSEFVGCIDAVACDQAETWFCVGGNAKPILMSSGCGPDNAEPCDAPADSLPDCP